MLKAKVNNKYNFTIQDGNEKEFDIIQIKEGVFHIIKDQKSYSADLIKINFEEKTFIIRVNGNKYTVQLKDKYDQLLEQMGMTNVASKKAKEVKAPMPGLVIDIKVKEGDEVKEGDSLVVLQAMKMENILKSPTNGIIKKINIKKDIAVEKNQVLILFT